jgi:hypothetical protein
LILLIHIQLLSLTDSEELNKRGLDSKKDSSQAGQEQHTNIAPRVIPKIARVEDVEREEPPVEGRVMDLTEDKLRDALMTLIMRVIGKSCSMKSEARARSVMCPADDEGSGIRARRISPPPNLNLLRQSHD